MDAGRFLLDADAYNHLRSLGLTPRFPALGVRILVTEFVARRELSQLSTEIRFLENEGVLKVMPVSARDENFRRLVKEGVDKGEAESIAFILSRPRKERPVFISCDKGARKHAAENGIECGDLLDLLIDLIDGGVLNEGDVRELLVPWDDKRQQRGRPADYSSFEVTVKQRRRRR